MKRRDTLVAVAGAGIWMTGTTAAFAGPKRRKADRGPKPLVAKALPFRSDALAGLSSTLIESHHQKNYRGAVRKLNAVRTKIAALDDSAPAFVRGALKAKELAFRNSVVLHELYFENLGGKGPPPSGLSKRFNAFGGAGAFEQQLKRLAMSQAGGSGWTLLSFDLTTSALMLAVAGDHTQGPAATVPLLALDMYEHSYALDYGANASKYVEAFYKNIQWEAVARRLDNAVAAERLLSRPH